MVLHKHSRGPEPFPAVAFQDYFSDDAASYAAHRPTYPRELYAWLAGIVPEGIVAWDCATGNGQAAIALADHFEKVIATDASEAQ